MALIIAMICRVCLRLLLLMLPTTSATTQQQEERQQEERQLQSNNPLYLEIKSYLTPFESSINSELFISETATGKSPSKIYKLKDMLAALPIVSDASSGMDFYLGEQSSASSKGYIYGLVNLAAFLAQCMKETIKYDACDENSWDVIDGLYALSNSCGQLGQSYQDYKCSPDEEHMECPVDPNMSIKATTNANWWGAPGPLFCGPKSEYEFVGVWEMGYYCDNKWAIPPESCNDYPGQKSGRYDNSSPVANRGGRTDVEGCCWVST